MGATMVRAGLAAGGAALVLIGGALAGCGDGGTERTRTTQADGVERIQLEPGSGSVRIRYERGARGEVRQISHGPTDPGAKSRIENGTLVLDTDCGWNCDIRYEVTLPARLPVEGELGSGGLDVTNMSAVRARVGSGTIDVRDVVGPVEVRTGSGGIRLTRITGAVDAETDSGQVEGRELRGGDVRAHTGSGGVRLGLAEPRSVDADTGSGSIELDVPRVPYRVDSDTGSGSVSVDVPQDPASPHHLRLSTGSGSASVRAAG
ncbi:hypothetical protein GCM10025787_42980 [Saccharopolyspora rosea]|uniref:DUF4097 domain-containing protein n=1 Tax=Saccharopolyspora rosea TaxID=524884 RepID=A0ABW3FI96_9PSEU